MTFLEGPFPEVKLLGESFKFLRISLITDCDPLHSQQQYIKFQN